MFVIDFDTLKITGKVSIDTDKSDDEYTLVYMLSEIFPHLIFLPRSNKC